MTIHYISARDVVRFMRALKEREQKPVKEFSFMSLLLRVAKLTRSEI